MNLVVHPRSSWAAILTTAFSNLVRYSLLSDLPLTVIPLNAYVPTNSSLRATVTVTGPVIVSLMFSYVKSSSPLAYKSLLPNVTSTSSVVNSSEPSLHTKLKLSVLISTESTPSPGLIVNWANVLSATPL